MECTTAKPAIKPNQPPIPEEILLNHFPEKHSKFLKHKESLKTHIRTCSDNYHYIKADSKAELPEKAKIILLKTWYDKYWYFMDELQDYTIEYYTECAQLMKIGKYETTRRSEKGATTSKVRRDEPHSNRSHTRLEKPQRAVELTVSSPKSTKTSRRYISESTKLAMITQHKNTLDILQSGFRAIRKDLQRSTEKMDKDLQLNCENLQQALLREKGASRQRSRRAELRTRPNHSVDNETKSSSHRSRMQAQCRVERSSTEPHAITQEGFKPSSEVGSHSEQMSKSAPSSQSNWKQVNAQMSTNLGSTESRFNPSKNSSQETSSQTSRAIEADSDTPSYNLSSQIHENDSRKCQPITPEGSRPSHRTLAESMLDPCKDSSPETSSHTADGEELNSSSKGVLTRTHTENDNSQHSPSRPEAQTVLLRPTRSLQKLLDSRNELEWRAHRKPNTQLRVRKPPDKEISELHGSYAVNNDVNSESVNKHSPLRSEAQAVPLHHTRNLQGFLESYPELEWRACSKSKLYMQRACSKPPDKSVSRGFQPETLKFIKSGVQHLSKMLLPAFDSVRCRQTRTVPCLEPNG
ncbi:hypothetical protein JOM56_003856 [Amanita muscaria]